MSIAAMMKSMMDAGANMETILAAVAAVEKTRVASPRPVFVGGAPKVYGPAVDPRLYDSPEKRRAYAMAAEHIAWEQEFGALSPMKRPREPEWLPLVGAVFRRDNHTCTYCGANGPGVKLHCDHIVPVSRGGDATHISNLTTACEFCNCSKGSKFPAEWNPLPNEANQ